MITCSDELNFERSSCAKSATSWQKLATDDIFKDRTFAAALAANCDDLWQRNCVCISYCCQNIVNFGHHGDHIVHPLRLVARFASIYAV